MEPKLVIEEFVLALEYYMDYYGLYDIDIKNLLDGTTNIVKDIKGGIKGPTITKADSISQLFGIRYYQLVNPEFHPLPKEKLPPATINAIDTRSESGPPESRKPYNSINLKKTLISALEAFKNKKEFLPSDIYETLPDELKVILKSSTRVTGAFSNELKDHVEKTNNILKKGIVGRPEEYYRVISPKVESEG